MEHVLRLSNITFHIRKGKQKTNQQNCITVKFRDFIIQKKTRTTNFSLFQLFIVFCLSVCLLYSIHYPASMHATVELMDVCCSSNFMCLDLFHFQHIILHLLPARCICVLFLLL